MMINKDLPVLAFDMMDIGIFASVDARYTHRLRVSIEKYL